MTETLFHKARPIATAVVQITPEEADGYVLHGGKHPLLGALDYAALFGSEWCATYATSAQVLRVSRQRTGGLDVVGSLAGTAEGRALFVTAYRPNYAAQNAKVQGAFSPSAYEALDDIFAGRGMADRLEALGLSAQGHAYRLASIARANEYADLPRRDDVVLTEAQRDEVAQALAQRVSYKDLAASLDLSVAALRDMLVSEGLVVRARPGRPAGRNADRDATIAARLAAGEPVASLAKEYDLTEVRVRQIGSPPTPPTGQRNLTVARLLHVLRNEVGEDETHRITQLAREAL